MDFKQTISEGLPSLQKKYSFESPKYNNVPAQDWMNTEMNAVEQFGWDTFRPTSMKGYLTDVDESYLGYTDESKNDIGWHTKDPSLSDVYKRGWPDPWSTPGANVPSTKGLTPPTPLNADLWKDAGGRVLTTPSSFSKEFDAAMERANRRQISPMADSQIISSHRNPDGSSVVAYVSGDIITYDANGNYTGRTNPTLTEGLGSISKQNTTTGSSSDNSGGGIMDGLVNSFKGDQSRAGSAVDAMLQFGFPPFMIMRNLQALFEPEKYGKGTAVGHLQGKGGILSSLGLGGSKNDTEESGKKAQAKGTTYVDAKGVLHTTRPGENIPGISPADRGRGFVSTEDMMGNYPAGVTDVTDVPGNVPGAGYSWGYLDGVGEEIPTPSAMDTFNPGNNFGYTGPAPVSEGGNSQNYNTGGGDNYGMTGEAGSGFGGFAEGTDAEDAASADAGYW
jgi:hypothetical protein